MYFIVIFCIRLYLIVFVKLLRLPNPNHPTLPGLAIKVPLVLDIVFVRSRWKESPAKIQIGTQQAQVGRHSWISLPRNFQTLRRMVSTCTNSLS